MYSASRANNGRLLHRNPELQAVAHEEALSPLGLALGDRSEQAALVSDGKSLVYHPRPYRQGQRTARQVFRYHLPLPQDAFARVGA
jgi:hypothetical protein